MSTIYEAFFQIGQNSTIDQTATDSPDLLVKCHLPNTKARKAYGRADWTRIGEEVARQMSPWRQIKTRPILD
ncbi:unnamed protein product [Penicillium camemberti]|uniref:Str. FM013 n=1 Tax=Penicillium camemberti (strain FM 013) TaxID=1429867 RepID=A0A0G4NZ89_PENC3|nr:unnamed protein product [Penicillium camemberti]